MWSAVGDLLTAKTTVYFGNFQRRTKWNERKFEQIKINEKQGKN